MLHLASCECYLYDSPPPVHVNANPAPHICECYTYASPPTPNLM